MWRMIKNLAPKVRHPEIRDSRTSADQGGEAEVGCFVEASEWDFTSGFCWICWPRDNMCDEVFRWE